MDERLEIIEQEDPAYLTEEELLQLRASEEEHEHGETVGLEEFIQREHLNVHYRTVPKS